VNDQVIGCTYLPHLGWGCAWLDQWLESRVCKHWALCKNPGFGFWKCCFFIWLYSECEGPWIWATVL